MKKFLCLLFAVMLILSCLSGCEGSVADLFKSAEQRAAEEQAILWERRVLVEQNARC